MTPLALSLMILSLLSLVLCLVFICIWICKDAKSRGQSGLVWVIITITSSPIIGLLSYLLAGRKEVRAPCQSCGWMISQSALYCERCGTAQQPALPSAADASKKPRRNLKYIIASIVSFVVMIGCLGTFIVAAIVQDGFLESGTLNSGVVVMNYNITWNGEWKTNCYYASDGYRNKNSFTVDDPATQTLQVETSCEEGQILLTIKQGELEQVYDVSDTKGQKQFSLSEFDAGRIQVFLELNGIKNMKSAISVQ